MKLQNRHPIYDLGKPTLRTRNCNLAFGDLSEEEMLALPYDLTEEEMNSAFSKYFDLNSDNLKPEQKIALEQPAMDPDKAFMPEEYARHMNNRGYCPDEYGYCVLPDGVGYAAVMINQDGITDEKIDLFNREFAPGYNLFYKIWLPGSHLLHYTDGAVENFGWGKINLKFISNVFIEDLGLNYSKIKLNDPACFHINGSSAVCHTLEGPYKGAIDKLTIVNYHRETENGRELRIRLWYGIAIENGKYVYSIPDGGTSQEQARKLMAHLIYEYQNNARLILQFWEDRKAGLI